MGGGQQDPFAEVRADVAQTMDGDAGQPGLRALFERWKVLAGDDSAPAQEEMHRLGSELRQGLRQVEWNVQDMQQMVDIVAAQPSRFKIGEEELDLRQSYVSMIGIQVDNMKRELARSGAPSSPAKGSTASPSAGADGAAGSPHAGDAGAPPQERLLDAADVHVAAAEGDSPPAPEPPKRKLFEAYSKVPLPDEVVFAEKSGGGNSPVWKQQKEKKKAKERLLSVDVAEAQDALAGEKGSPAHYSRVQGCGCTGAPRPKGCCSVQ